MGIVVTVPSAAALIFSPLLLRGIKTGGSPGRQRGVSSSQSETVVAPARTSGRASSPSPLAVDFGREDELMRYKHELMGLVYEKSLNRGFAGQPPEEEVAQLERLRP